MPADLPSGYSSGNVSLAANTPYNLGIVIEQQLDSQASLSATMLYIQADAGNAAPVYIGMNNAVGTGTPPAFGRSIAPGANASYGSGASSAIQVGRFYVYSTAAALLHIELLP